MFLWYRTGLWVRVRANVEWGVSACLSTGGVICQAHSTLTMCLWRGVVTKGTEHSLKDTIINSKTSTNQVTMLFFVKVRRSSHDSWRSPYRKHTFVHRVHRVYRLFSARSALRSIMQRRSHISLDAWSQKVMNGLRYNLKWRSTHRI
jgi:hypothetical protein